MFLQTWKPATQNIFGYLFVSQVQVGDTTALQLLVSSKQKRDEVVNPQQCKTLRLAVLFQDWLAFFRLKLGRLQGELTFYGL